MVKYRKVEVKDKDYEEPQTFRIPSSSESRQRNRMQIPDLNLEITGDEDEEEDDDEEGEAEENKVEKEDTKTGVLQPQDADYSGEFLLPQLSDELELSILARFPQPQLWKILSLNKKLAGFVRSSDIFKTRRQIGFTEPSVFMKSEGDTCWRAFDRDFTACKKLPELRADDCFLLADKESLCAGSHLIISGLGIGRAVIWRYELETNKWFKGSMITPRCLFASASRGPCAFVAGGIRVESGHVAEALNTAEKYNVETKLWVSLPKMQKRRSFSSGCYLDGKFYVIGGKNELNKNLTCAERYDEGKNAWELIPNMLQDAPFPTLGSPPLIAVVKNELYWLEPSSNELRVYRKSENAWKRLGIVPVIAKPSGGWGVAFKALGDELLVIGAPLDKSSSSSLAMTVYKCRPSPALDVLKWKEVQCCCRYQPSHFIRNCAVMVA